MKVIVNILALILACTVTAAVVTGCIDKGDDSSSEAQGADTTASDVKDDTVSEPDKTEDDKTEDEQPDKTESEQPNEEENEVKIYDISDKKYSAALEYKSVIADSQNNGARANIEFAELKEGKLSLRLKLTQAPTDYECPFVVNALYYDTNNRLMNVVRLTSFTASQANIGKEYSAQVQIDNNTAKVVIPSYTTEQKPIISLKKQNNIKLEYDTVIADKSGYGNKVSIDAVTVYNYTRIGNFLGISYTAKEFADKTYRSFAADVVCYDSANKEIYRQQVMYINEFSKSILGITYYDVISLPADTQKVKIVGKTVAAGNAEWSADDIKTLKEKINRAASLAESAMNTRERINRENGGFVIIDYNDHYETLFDHIKEINIAFEEIHTLSLGKKNLEILQVSEATLADLTQMVCYEYKIIADAKTAKFKRFYEYGGSMQTRWEADEWAAYNEILDAVALMQIVSITL